MIVLISLTVRAFVVSLLSASCLCYSAPSVMPDFCHQATSKPKAGSDWLIKNLFSYWAGVSKFETMHFFN